MIFSSRKRQLLLAPIAALALSLGACGGTQTTEGTGGSSSGQSVSLTGAGASFPAPLYQKWFAEYNKQNPKTPKPQNPKTPS